MWSLLALFRNAKTRAAQWRALLMVALAFARQTAGLARTQPHKALEQTEFLETWIWFASAELSHQLSAEGLQADAEQPFSQRLSPIAVILHMLLIFVHRMKAGLADQTAKKMPVDTALSAARIRTVRRFDVPYVDTG